MTQHAELIERLRRQSLELTVTGKASDYSIGDLAADALEAQEREIEALRKKAERYDYLTLQHGDYCVADASNSRSIIKGGAADRLIDAAKGEPQGIPPTT